MNAFTYALSEQSLWSVRAGEINATPVRWHWGYLSATSLNRMKFLVKRNIVKVIFNNLVVMDLRSVLGLCGGCPWTLNSTKGHCGIIYTGYSCKISLREKDGKYVTIQVPSVESVSDKNLLASVQRWELFLSLYWSILVKIKHVQDMIRARGV